MRERREKVAKEEKEREKKQKTLSLRLSYWMMLERLFVNLYSWFVFSFFKFFLDKRLRQRYCNFTIY